MTADNDAQAWNAFVQRHGAQVLAATMGWCEGGCGVPRSRYGCVLRAVRCGLPEPAEDPDLCREGLHVYEWASAGLRARLAEAPPEGPAREAWLARTLDQLRDAYFASERAALAGRLGLDPAALEAAERAVRERMAVEQAAGTTLGPVEPPMPPPAWVNRPVLDHSVSDSPEPEAAGEDWRKKVFSQPDWWSGLALGAVISALMLIVILPRQEYARPVQTPEDRQLAEAAVPLAADLAGKLAAAREQLARGQIDAAVQNLDGVLARRPENQEARWLLASTFDRLGDQARAAKHYKVFLEVHERARAVEDERARQARERLGRWTGTP